MIGTESTGRRAYRVRFRMRLEGRTALVTGGGSGIGAATCRRLAAEGARVAVTDVNLATAEEVASEIGGGAFELDVRSTDSVRGAVEAAESELAPLDVLVNNAGYDEFAFFTETDEGLWDRVIAVNLRGVFLGMKRQIRQMLKGGGGSIVNTASNAGLRGVKRLSPYTAAKHGLVGLTKNAAVEYAEDLIRVNAVAPGTIMTGFARNSTPERLKEIMRPQALQRIGEAEEVAAAVVWLLSDDASFVTGVTLPVDAGSVAGW